MIALNELISKKAEFEEKYRKMRFRAKISDICELEDERKVVQLKYEKLRSELNKKCSNIATLRNKNLDTISAMQEIEADEKEVFKLEKVLENYAKKINHLLETLPNLPDEVVLNDEIVSETKNSLTYDEIKEFFEEKFNIVTYSQNLNKYTKSLKKRVFAENELPFAAVCNDGISVFACDFDVEEDFKQILEFFKANSKMVVKIASRHADKSSAQEYAIVLGKFQAKLCLAREYYTREFSVKYRNLSIDMTKFVNQIILKIKRWVSSHLFFFWYTFFLVLHLLLLPQFLN